MQIYLLFAAVFAIIGSIVASSKNRSPLGWALVTGMFGLLGLLILVAQPAAPKLVDDLRV